MMKMKRIRRRGWSGGWVRWFDNDDERDGIPSLSVVVLLFFFLSCFSFLLSFSFFCSFLSFLMHTSGGRKAVPWGLHIDERDVRRIDRERERQIKRQKNGRPFAEENEKIKF